MGNVIDTPIQPSRSWTLRALCGTVRHWAIRGLPVREINIGVFAPSDPLTAQRLAAVRRNADRLRALGFRMLFAPSVAHHPAGPAAASPQARAQEIMDLAQRHDVDILMGAWGGKTCNELLDSLDFALLGELAKPIVGFSDVAVLCNAMTMVTGSPTVFGPNVLGKLHESDHGDLAFVRTGFAAGLEPFAQTPTVEQTWRGQAVVEGRLFGGNLGTFALALAPWRRVVLPEDAILFFETTNEYERVVRQYLGALQVAGILRSVRGLILGDLPFLTSRRRVEEFVDYLHDRLGVPIAQVPVFGHGQFPNPPVPIGLQCRMDGLSRSIRTLESWDPLSRTQGM
jgi:muramoyltetrapeptide carboxypeptidase